MQREHNIETAAGTTQVECFADVLAVTRYSELHGRRKGTLGRGY
jgi:hypothetical protein